MSIEEFVTYMWEEQAPELKDFVERLDSLKEAEGGKNESDPDYWEFITDCTEFFEVLKIKDYVVFRLLCLRPPLNQLPKQLLKYGFSKYFDGVRKDQSFHNYLAKPIFAVLKQVHPTLNISRKVI